MARWVGRYAFNLNGCSKMSSNSNGNSHDTEETDVMRLVLQELRDMRDAQLNRDEELDKRIDRLEEELRKRLNKVETSLDLVLAQQQAHGNELSELKGQCRKRLEICHRGGGSKSASYDSLSVEEL